VDPFQAAAIARLYCVSFADRAIADPGEGPRPRWSCFREFYLSSQLYRVMIRPIKALAALAEEIKNRIRPQLTQMKGLRASRAGFGRF